MAPLTPEQQELVTANIGLAHWSRRHSRHFGSLLSDDELYSASCLGLCRAAVAFDPARGKFTTIASRAMFRQCLYEFRRKVRRLRLMPEPSGDVGTAMARDSSQDYEQLDIDEWLSKLPDREWTVIRERLKGRPSVEIAADIGVSRCYAGAIIRSAYERRSSAE